jgi:formate/nitrite transporter FocA (FNT family)
MKNLTRLLTTVLCSMVASAFVSASTVSYFTAPSGSNPVNVPVIQADLNNLVQGINTSLAIPASMSFVANGAVATTVTSLGPTGSHTTIQEWLQVTDANGVIRWIPAY